MTTIASPRALPNQGTPAPEAISTTADVIELVKRSNHATAFAGWTVITIAMSLVFQAERLRTVESFTMTLVLMGLLVPILVATARTGILLVGAGHAASVAGGESEPTGAAAGALDAAAHEAHEADDHEAAARLARDRLWSTLTSAQARERLARRALVWSYGSGTAFLTWSLAVILLASR